MAQTDVFGIAALAQSYRQQNHKAAQGERVELRLHIDSDDAETDLIVEDMALYF